MTHLHEVLRTLPPHVFFTPLTKYILAEIAKIVLTTLPLIIRFGDFEVNEPTGELRSRGHQIKLQEKPFQVLMMLLKRPGEMVGRDELRRKLWPSGAYGNPDHSLCVAIAKLRKAFADPKSEKRYIETLASRGYRFVGTIKAPDQAPLKPANSRISKGRTTLAVRHFEDFSKDPRHSHFATGLTEEVVAQVEGLLPQWLGVTTGTPMVRYEPAEKGMDRAGTEREADFYLHGTVCHARGRMVISVKLFRANHRVELWAETLDREFSDPTATQREVAGCIARSIALELLPPSRWASALRLSSADSDAYLTYLRGLRQRACLTEEGMRESIKSFEQAMKKDPNFVLAYSGLANSCSLLGWLAPGTMKSRELYLRAKELALKVIEMDSSLAEGYTSLAIVKFFYDWDWVGAQQAVSRAIELNSNYLLARVINSLNLANQGHLEEAITEILRARKIDPLSPPTNMFAGFVLYLCRKFDEAIEELQRASKLVPTSVKTLTLLSRAYLQKSMFGQAKLLLERAREIQPANMSTMAWLGYAYGLEGRKSEVRKVLLELSSARKHHRASSFDIVLVYMGLGQTTHALDWLVRAYRERHSCLIMANVDPLFDRLRSEPRFQNLMRRLGF